MEPPVALTIGKPWRTCKGVAKTALSAENFTPFASPDGTSTPPVTPDNELVIPDPINYTDTAFDDTFATVTAKLQNTYIDIIIP